MDIVEKDAWVIEGVYWSWCGPSFERADEIILLDTPVWIRQKRIGIRFIKRKLGVEQSLKKDSFQGYLALARWNARWDRDNLLGAKEALRLHNTMLKVQE